MQFLPKDLEAYASLHSQAEPFVLRELQKETHQKVLNPRMLSGAAQGRFLSMASKIMRPKYILEIGTYTGYSAICLAEGLAEDGKLITIDVNEELEWIWDKYFEKAGFSQQIETRIGAALDIIPSLDEGIDMAFIDADKKNYKAYFDSILTKMNKGGLILSDNVLWSGKVIEPLNPKDFNTKALLDYNAYINDHPSVETVLLPLRDGLTMSRVL